MPRNNVWSYNRGEWTEAYVFLKLLGVGKIYGGDINFKKDPNTYFNVLDILRNENSVILRFNRSESDVVTGYADENQFVVVASKKFLQNADLVLQSISNSSSAKIEIPPVQQFMKDLRISTPKPVLSSDFRAKYGAKTDIVIRNKAQDGFVSVGGYSIKSHVGSAPTLLNASQTSNFVYEVEGCTEQLMHEINIEGTFKTIVKKIKDLKLNLRFVELENSTYADNLQIIDSNMVKILSETLLLASQYKTCSCGVRKSDKSCKALVTALSTLNPVGVNRPAHFYESKFKDLLFASFAGMTASKEWDGRRHLTGGYIDVDNDGEMLFFRALSDDVFMTYLFDNTKLDFPDCGAKKKEAVVVARNIINGMTVSDESSDYGDKRANYGYVYKDDASGKFYFNINFQIRFK